MNSGILPYPEPGPGGGQAAEWGAETIRYLLPFPPPLLLEVGWLKPGDRKGSASREEGKAGTKACRAPVPDPRAGFSNTVTKNTPKLAVRRERGG